jgi:phage-related tail protein
MEVITKMANTIRIKRRGSAGATGAPESLENAELAFNEADNTLYYGKGTGGAGGTATSVEAIGGVGAFVTSTSPL